MSDNLYLPGFEVADTSGRPAPEQPAPFASCRLIMGDCLEVMAGMPDGSIDAIMADLPYGTTGNPWDSLIPLDRLWEHYGRLIKPRGAIVLNASQPFTTALINSKREWFKYVLVWVKEIGRNFYNARYQPLKSHEDIVVFGRAAASYSPRGSMVYNPQMEEGKPYVRATGGKGKHHYHGIKPRYGASSQRYPKSVLRFNSETGLHETQKPVALMEYLVKTYTNPGDTVLDNTMGSGTTILASVRCGRRAIGIEKDPGIFAKAVARLESAGVVIDTG